MLLKSQARSAEDQDAAAKQAASKYKFRRGPGLAGGRGETKCWKPYTCPSRYIYFFKEHGLDFIKGQIVDVLIP